MLAFLMLCLFQQVASQLVATNDLIEIIPNTPTCLSVLGNDIISNEQISFKSIQNATEGNVFQNYPAFHLANVTSAAFEAESYQELNYRANDSTYYDTGNTNYWEVVNFYDGSSAGSAMRVWPPNIKNTGDSKFGPAIRFDVGFLTSGSYRVWVRGRGCTGCNTTAGGFCKNCSSDSNHDDSLHLLSRNSSSLSFVSNGNPANGFDAPWEWQEFPTLLQVAPSEISWPPQRKSIYLAQRDDGVVIDRILITSDISTDYSTLYGKSKLGPPSSPLIQCRPDQLLYIPNQNFTGIDSFTYSISTGSTQTSTANVQLYVGVPLPSSTPSATPSVTPSPGSSPSTSSTPLPSQSASPTSDKTPKQKANVGLIIGLLIAGLLLVVGAVLFVYYMQLVKNPFKPGIEFASLVQGETQEENDAL